MKKTALTFLLGALLVAVASAGIAQGVRNKANLDLPMGPLRSEKSINAHYYGVGVVVLNAAQNPGVDRIIQVRDLGPNIKDLREDRAPASAYLRVDQQTLPFALNSKGVLEITLPSALFLTGQPVQIVVTAWDAGGTELIRVDLKGMLL